MIGVETNIPLASIYDLPNTYILLNILLKDDVTNNDHFPLIRVVLALS